MPPDIPTEANWPAELNRDAQFQELRPTLFSLAYRMLGTRADAEDVVQEAWLRWQAATQSQNREDIRLPKSFLTTIVARLSLDALKAAHRKRESYVGPWLPEPLIEPPGTHAIEMAELLSMAFLHMLESLSPAERVAFLMREAFDSGYDEISAVLETSEENSRQLVARARKHIEGRRPRFPVDRARHQKLLEQFLAACATGDSASFTGLLSEDVVLYSDGGGKASAALNPIYGAERVVKFLVGIARKGPTDYRLNFADVNGEPGAVLIAPDGARMVIAIDLVGDLLSGIFFMVNPEKIVVY
jgi:RNA polymerase sigma-70 factor, ECF subfamily